MSNVHHIADAVGRKEIAEATGVGISAVKNAIVRGRFPASWYLIVSELAARHGVECPPECFGMRTADGSCLSAADGDSPSHVQGGLPE